MALDLSPLIVVERSGLEEDLLLDDELADVVKRAREQQVVDPVVVEPSASPVITL